MIAKKIKGGYQLESPTINGVFLVKLTLTDDGQESIETCSTAIEFCFPIQKLDPGTIEKVIGPSRWGHLMEMKDKNIDRMFIDPQNTGHRGEAPRTW